MTGERTGRWLGDFLTVTAGLAVLSILSLVTMTYLNIRYAIRLPDVLPISGMPDGRGISGLVQRVLFGLEAVVLFTLAVRLLRIAVAHPAPSPVRAEVPG